MTGDGGAPARSSRDFVLDRTVTASWLACPPALTPYVVAVMRATPGVDVVVPSCWPADVVRETLVIERRGERTPTEVDHYLATLAKYVIRVDRTWGKDYWQRLTALMRGPRLTASDAAYLELAQRLGLPLATVSPKLRRAATALGVPIFAP